MDLVNRRVECRGAGREAHRLEPAEPVGVDVGSRLDVEDGLAPFATKSNELSRIVRIAAAHDDNRLDPVSQPFEGALMFLGREADRVDEADLRGRVPRLDRPRGSSSAWDDGVVVWQTIPRRGVGVRS